MPSLNLKPSHKPVKVYYETLQQYERIGVSHEGAVRQAFSDLLKSCCSQFDWTLVTEWQIKRAKQKPLQVDGALVATDTLPRGYWEAKDIKDNLDKEIKKKFQVGYPKDNILFQTPKRVILWQGGKQILDEDISQPSALVDSLRHFFEDRTPLIARWEIAAVEFGGRVKELGDELVEIIAKERQSNAKFIQAFSDFFILCRSSRNPNLSEKAIEEMLIQHLLTERIFRKIFDNPDFIHRNVIAVEIEKVIKGKV
uniref:hypothetical protein n=1 Tax=Hassallia byssoidea TaxID=482630 RepID=UPI0005849576|nr:hypothetical protein [Hassalia byssoidea]